MLHWKYTGNNLAARELKKTAELELAKHEDFMRLGNLSQHKSIRNYVDGSSVECRTTFGDTIVTVNVPSKEHKEDYENLVTMVSETWVMLLNIRDKGVLVVDQKFNFVKLFLYDDTEDFDGFKNWDKFYGFKRSWGNYGVPAGKEPGTYFEIEELNRLSEYALIQSDLDSNSHSNDTGWEPGGKSLYIGEILASMYGEIYGPNLSGTLWVPNSGWSTANDPIYEDMGNQLFNDNCYLPYAVAMGYWCQSAYGQACADDSYNVIDGLDTSAFQRWCWRTGQYHHKYRRVGIFSVDILPSHLEWIKYELDMLPYPDGPQRRSYNKGYEGSQWWYFSSDEGDTDVVLSYEYSFKRSYDSWAEGTWVYDSETPNDNKQITEDWNADYDSNCCTKVNPKDCLKNEVFAYGEHWFFIADKTSAYNVSVTWHPCIYTAYWDKEGVKDPWQVAYPDGIPQSYYSYINIDGRVKDDGWVIDTVESTTNGFEYSVTEDTSIYSINGEPLYVFHYRHMVEYGEWDYIPPGVAPHNLMFIFRGELHQSPEFQSVSEHGYSFDNLTPDKLEIDVGALYPEVAKIGGYWDGQVRVAKYKVYTCKKEGVKHER